MFNCENRKITIKFFIKTCFRFHSTFFLTVHLDEQETAREETLKTLGRLYCKQLSSCHKGNTFGLTDRITEEAP